MSPITDEQVARLPIEGGRNALLETIVSTPVSHREPASPSRGWFRASAVVGIAAASVAAIVALPVWLGRDAPLTTQSEPGSSPRIEVDRRSVPADDRLYPVVDGTPPGWEFGGASARPLVSISYQKDVTFEGEPGAMTFMVEVRDAADDGAMVSGGTTQDGRRAGSIDVGGRTARVWELVEKPGSGIGECASGCVHHWSAITPVENGQYVLVAASGLGPGSLSEREWQRLVAGVGFSDREGFEAWAPSSLLFDDEIDAAAAEAFSRTSLPPEYDPPSPSTADFTSRSALEIDVALAAGCAWVQHFRGGDAAAQRQARDALAAVSRWPLYAALPGPMQGLFDVVAAAADDTRPEAEWRNVLGTCDD